MYIICIEIQIKFDSMVIPVPKFERYFFRGIPMTEKSFKKIEGPAFSKIEV